MSVYIKSMEMPTEEQEPFRFELYADGAVVQLMPPDNDCEFKAIPIPDHDDLIERDTLPWYLKDVTEILEAPTIIPADKEDGE